MTNNSGELDGRAAWTVAAAAVAILTIAYGAPLIAVLAMKPIATELQTQRSGAAVGSPADAASAVQAARQFLQSPQGAAKQQMLPVEVEVDSLDQLAAVLPAGPDIVLLDNMPPALLREAVKLRDQVAPHVELEASGGVRLETLREIAATGVERISVGALTHSARVLDIGLDWQG